ncbi:hypothetical protein HDE69_002754 [Pedobacter cryoconitis]|uniref:Uncharacterized protein n=1 Tax=Pedobacter cryoconitis TaxID=188932 RepID=A0A7W8YTT8_9SPHI|nr:hypothetical protein [Pedobacter cryoconitis]
MKYKFACTLFNIETMQNDQIAIYKTENGEIAIVLYGFHLTNRINNCFF